MKNKDVCCDDDCKYLKNNKCEKYNVILEEFNLTMKIKCFMCRNKNEESTTTNKNS
jgi:hypothetical protein